MHDGRRGCSGHERLRARLPHAEVTGETLVAKGEYGGMVYFTVPAPAIACSADALVRLLHEVDAVLSADPDGIQTSFAETVSGTHVAGGTGGGWITGELWVHDVIRGSAFAERIADVLAGRLARIWPAGSEEDGAPERPTDLVDLLEAETGDAPAPNLIRRAIGAMRKPEDPDYEPRLRTTLHRLLHASNARNRIEAAEHLLFSVPDDEIVDALRDVAVGDVAFPHWGMWRAHAVALIGRLARCGDEPAWRVLADCARSDGWIADYGPRAFCGMDWDHRYAEPPFFRAALAKMDPTRLGEARPAMPKLTRIYTRTGDDGTTGLVGGQRVRKNAQRIEAYGTVDELSSVIGLARTALGDVLRTRPVQDIARAHAVARELDAWLAWTQDALFNLGSDLATLPKDRWEGMPLIAPGDAAALERAIDRAQQDLEPLATFILPGGSYPGAFLHQARTVCRRAERLLITLGDTEPLSPDVVRYVNRLSDALFVWSRWINHALDQPEHQWNAKTAPPET